MLATSSQYIGMDKDHMVLNVITPMIEYNKEVKNY